MSSEIDFNLVRKVMNRFFNECERTCNIFNADVFKKDLIDKPEFEDEDDDLKEITLEYLRNDDILSDLSFSFKLELDYFHHEEDKFYFSFRFCISRKGSGISVINECDRYWFIGLDSIEKLNKPRIYDSYKKFISGLKDKYEKILKYTNFKKCPISNCMKIIKILDENFCQDHYHLELDSQSESREQVSPAQLPCASTGRSHPLGWRLDKLKEIECCICKDDDCIDEEFKTECNHTYHKSCIEKHLENNDKCPLCRKKIKK